MWIFGGHEHEELRGALREGLCDEGAGDFLGCSDGRLLQQHGISEPQEEDEYGDEDEEG